MFTRKQIKDMPAGPQKRAMLAQLMKELAPGAKLRHRPGEMNKTEAAYARRLSEYRAAGEVSWYLFERLKLKLDIPDDAKGKSIFYTVDFVVGHADGRITFDEVKGGFITEDAMLKFRWASQQFIMFHFRMFQKKRGGSWDLIRESRTVKQ